MFLSRGVPWKGYFHIDDATAPAAAEVTSDAADGKADEAPIQRMSKLTLQSSQPPKTRPDQADVGGRTRTLTSGQPRLSDVESVSASAVPVLQPHSRTWPIVVHV